MDRSLEEIPQPKPWRPRISLRALLFVVLCVALGGTYTTLLVREVAEKKSREAQAAAGELPARWQELKEAVQRLDPRAQPVFARFEDAAEQANSSEALRAALGEPDQPGGNRWTSKAAGGADGIAVTVNYDGRQLQTSFNESRGSGSSSRMSSVPYPRSLRMGTHPDAFVLAAGVGGMLAGGFCGLLAWICWRLLRRTWRRFHSASKTAAS